LAVWHMLNMTVKKYKGLENKKEKIQKNVLA